MRKPTTNTTELREPLVKIPDEPDQTKYERDTLIWMQTMTSG